MKKSLLFLIVLVLGITGCSKNKNSDSDREDKNIANKTNTESTENQDEEESARTLYEEVMGNLETEYGIYEAEQSGRMTKVEDKWLNPYGILGSSICDFDSDGEEELLVCIAEPYVVEEPGRDESEGSMVFMRMYDVLDGEAVLADRIPFVPYRDEIEKGFTILANNAADEVLNMNLLPVNDTFYIVCDYYCITGYYSDGESQGCWILEYDGEQFGYVSSFTQTAGGSAEFEFTIYEFEEGNLMNHYVCYVEDENTEWDTELDDIELYWQNNGIKPIDNPEKGRTADTVLYSLDENHMTQIFQLKFNGESIGSSYSEYTFHSKLMSNLDGLK